MNDESPVCDFCGSEDVRWSYPCETFRREETKTRTDDLGQTSHSYLDHGFVGNWAACGDCYIAYEKGGRDGLVDRIVGVYAQKNPILADEVIQEQVRAKITSLYAQFEMHRAGSAVPYQRR